MLNGRRTRGKTYLGRLQHLQSFVLDSKVAETRWQAQALYYLQYDLWYGKLAIPPYLGDFLSLWVMHFVSWRPAFLYHHTNSKTFCQFSSYHVTLLAS